jgi:hypothetical protein
MKKAHTGHRGDSGIQEHSCGPIFPYHIVQKGNNTLYAMHADGTELDHHLFDRKGEKRYNQDHKAAHHRATEQARVALAGEAEAARELEVLDDVQVVQIPIRQTSKAS